MITIFDMSDRERQAFIESVVRPSSTRARREHVTARANVMRGDFASLLGPWVREIYEEPDVIHQVLKHAFALYNPLKRAANRLAVAYSRRPRRAIKGKKAATKQLDALLRTVRYDRRARYANRNGVALNTVIALPLPRVGDDGEPTIEVRFCHGGNSEILQATNAAKHAAPEIVAWLTTTAPSMLLNNAAPVVTVADASGWSTWNTRGDRVGEPLLHNLGRVAAVPLHMADDDDDDDWYDGMVNQEILEATKRVALVAASMDWTRKTQCRNLLTITEATETAGGEDGDEQVIGDPENATKWRGEGLSVQVQDFATSVAGFVEHMRTLTDEGLEIMTGTISTLSDPDPSSPLEGNANAQQHAALQLHQGEQLAEIEPFDARLVWMVTALASEIGMDVPDPALVKERLQTEYAPVPYIEGQRERLEYYILATKFGVADQVEFMREQTGATEDEAEKRLIELAERRSRIRVPLEEHQTGAEPTQEADPALPGESTAAQQGRVGGRSSMPSEAEASR